MTVAPQKKPSVVGDSAVPDRDESATVALVTALRLHWFIRLRWIFVVVSLTVLALEQTIFPGTQRPMELVLVVVALAGANLVWMAYSYLLFRRFESDESLIASHARHLEFFANGQVAVDLFLLTAILRYTGGAENPLAIFYLFHMAIVSLVLRRWQAITQGGWAVLLYGSMVICDWRGWITPHYPLLPNVETELFRKPEYVLVSLLAVNCGILGMLYFTQRLAQSLAKRQRQLRLANAALEQSQQAIQDLQRRRSRFMQTAAHQLKSPLAVIQTLTDLIRSEVVPPEAIASTCDKIIRRSREGIAQVTELLTLARVQEADPTRHGNAQSDVQRVVSELCQRFKPLAEEKKLTWNCDIGNPGEFLVRCDPHDLRDCVGNLIENAIKYTPGPGTVSVYVGTTRNGPNKKPAVAITVSDTGMGIDPAILRPDDNENRDLPAFDAFRRGNNVLTAGIPGTGLGLSIVREVVEQAGGLIRVSSKPEQGTTFTVTLPVYGASKEQPIIRTTRASEVVDRSAGS